MRIWDLPTRLFHWCLVILILASWLSAELGWMRTHVVSGLAIASLLIFRIVWGFIGSDTARFSHFLRHPADAIRHLSRLTRREPDTEPGHSAAGGWMVVAMLGLLCANVGTGLFANDDQMTEGPLAQYVDKYRSDWFAGMHSLAFTLLEIAVALHVLAIVAYRVLKGQNLLLPMITGRKRLPGVTPAPAMMHSILALAVYAVGALAIVLFLWLVRYTP